MNRVSNQPRTPSSAELIEFNRLLKTGKGRHEIKKEMFLDDWDFQIFLHAADSVRRPFSDNTFFNNVTKLQLIFRRIEFLINELRTIATVSLKERYEKELDDLIPLYVQSNPMEDIVELPENLKQ